MKETLQTLWKWALLVLTFIVGFFLFQSGELAGGYDKFYFIATGVLMVALLLVDPYERVGLGVGVLVVMGVFALLGGIANENAGFVRATCVFLTCFSIGLTFVYLFAWDDMTYDIWVTVLGVATPVAFLLMGFLYESLANFMLIINVALAVGVPVLSFLFSKVKGLFSGMGSSSNGSSRRSVSIDTVSSACRAYNRDYSGRYSASAQRSGNKIIVRVQYDDGSRASGSEAAMLRSYLERYLGCNLNHTNVEIRY